MSEYLARYEAGEHIAAIAASVQYSPYLLARQFVEALLCVDKKAMSKTMKCPDTIPDARLRLEVHHSAPGAQHTRCGVQSPFAVTPPIRPCHAGGRLH